MGKNASKLGGELTPEETALLESDGVEMGLLAPIAIKGAQSVDGIRRLINKANEDGDGMETVDLNVDMKILNALSGGITDRKTRNNVRAVLNGSINQRRLSQLEMTNMSNALFRMGLSAETALNMSSSQVRMILRRLVDNNLYEHDASQVMGGLNSSYNSLKSDTGKDRDTKDDGFSFDDPPVDDSDDDEDEDDPDGDPDDTEPLIGTNDPIVRGMTDRLRELIRTGIISVVITGGAITGIVYLGKSFESGGGIDETDTGEEHDEEDGDPDDPDSDDPEFGGTRGLPPDHTPPPGEIENPPDRDIHRHMETGQPEEDDEEDEDPEFGGTRGLPPDHTPPVSGEIPNPDDVPNADPDNPSTGEGDDSGQNIGFRTTRAAPSMGQGWRPSVVLEEIGQDPDQKIEDIQSNEFFFNWREFSDAERKQDWVQYIWTQHHMRFKAPLFNPVPAEVAKELKWRIKPVKNKAPSVHVDDIQVNHPFLSIENPTTDNVPFLDEVPPLYSNGWIE